MNGQSLRILAGLVLGLAAGALLAGLGLPALPLLLQVAAPIGKLWLDGLTMTVVPLVFGLLVVGVAAPAADGNAQALTGRTLAWFAVLLVAACAVSALVVSALMTAWPVQGGAAMVAVAGPAPEVAAPGDWISGFIPTNPIKAAAETAIAPLVVFALLFAFALRTIEAPLRESVITLLRAIVETMLVIVRWVLWLGPLGVMALAFAVGAHMGAAAAGTLVRYVLQTAGVGLLIAVLAYAVAALLGRMSPLAFARAALPAQIVALSTQSSLASLPAMIEAGPLIERTPGTAAVVLPLAVSIFRAASAAANVAVAVYLAHFHGVALGPGDLVVAVLVGAVVSLAAVGLPAQVSFFATIAPVCLALHTPLVMLPILLAVETIPDIFRTLGNVTADLAVSRVVSNRGQGAAPSVSALRPT